MIVSALTIALACMTAARSEHLPAASALGTGEQVFFAVPLSGAPPIELVRYIGEWGLSGVPDDVIPTVSVGGDHILVARSQYSLGPFDCGSSPQSTCQYSWFEFGDLFGETVEELHNPAPVPSLSGAPLSDWPTGRLSADGRMLVYESTSDEWATVAVDLDTGRELARSISASSASHHVSTCRSGVAAPDLVEVL